MPLTLVDRHNLLNNSMRVFLEHRLSFALSRFDSRIRKITVIIEDVNGPRGGIDKSCRITVQLKESRDIVIGDQDADVAKCIAHAAERVGRSVARAVDRSRRGHVRKPHDIGSL
jgi:ribosome hibernation promoting factor